jgi:hypothetical protein
LKWAVPVVGMERGIIVRGFVYKPDKKTPKTWALIEDNINTDLNEKWPEGLDWTNVFEGRVNGGLL